MSLMFKEIWKCNKEEGVRQWLSNKSFLWKVGDGSKVKFWKDLWRGIDALATSFSRLYSLSLNKNISVAEMKVQ